MRKNSVLAQASVGAALFALLLALTARAEDRILEQNGDGTTRVTVNVVDPGDFSRLEFAEFLKTETGADFLELSSMSERKITEKLLNLGDMDEKEYEFEFVARKNGRYYTAKCGVAVDLHLKFVMINTSTCDWYENGASASQGLFTEELPFYFPETQG